MEESNLQPNPVSNPQVGFPQNPPRAKSKMSLVFFIILGIILLIGAVIFFISRSANEAVPSPSPTSFFSAPSPTPTPEASPEASPTSEDKSELSVEILNGTGIPGEASYLQGQLKNLGYENVTAANASTQNETSTTVTFARDVSTAVKDELEAELEKLYTDVNVSTSSTLSGVDIRILTGLRKGASPKASAASSPAASSTATPTASSSATPTASPN